MENQFQRFELRQKEEEKYLILDPNRKDLLTMLISQKYRIGQLDELIASATSNIIEEQYRGYVGMRRLISIQNPPINLFIGKELITLLPAHINGNLQLYLQTLRIFTFIASGSDQESASLIEKGALPFLLGSLASDVEPIVLEGIWTVANLLGDSDKNRKIFINEGVIQVFLKLLESTSYVNYVNNEPRISSLIWALSNICRGKPSQHYSIIRPILHVFAKIYRFVPFDDEDMLEELTWSIANYVENESEVRQILIDEGSIKNIIDALEMDIYKINVPTLIILHQLIRFDKKVGLQCLQIDKFPIILKEKLHKGKAIRSLTIEIISELFQNQYHQLRPLLLNEPFMAQLFQRMENGSVELRRAICEAFNKLLRLSYPIQILQIFIRLNAFQNILTEISYFNVETLNIFLQFIYSLLLLGQKNKDNGTNIVRLDFCRRIQQHEHACLFQKIKCRQSSDLTFQLCDRILSFV